MSYTSLFTPRLFRIADVSLLFQCLHRTVVEFRGHDDSTTTGAPRGDLNGLSLSRGDVVALLAPKLGQGH